MVQANSGSKPAKAFETYKKKQTLGVGSFGTAYLVECQSNGSLAVIKQIDIAQMSEEERRETLNEAKILEVLSHPNIVRFREVYKTKKGKLCIVMDYADGGDLQSKIKERYKQRQSNGRMNYLTEDQLLNWFTQICLAMKHCHDKKILHRDLKSQNIFMTKNGLIKLGDFGIARVLSNTKSKAKTVVGTPYYLSPEIIRSESYSFKSDIWSLGVLLYEMAALQPPFNAQSLHQLAQRIIQGKYAPLPSHFSSQVTEVLSMMLKRDPAQRPNIHQLLKVPCIENRIQNFLNNDTFKEEFAHTLLHNQNVFDEFKRIQAAKKAEEERQATAASVAAQAQNLNLYQPPSAFVDKYKDPQFFAYAHQKYAEELQKEQNDDDTTTQASNRVSAASSSTQEDRNDQDDDGSTPAFVKNDSVQSSASSGGGGGGQYQKVYGNVDKEEMINIASCDFETFKDYMSGKFGQAQFQVGFEVIKSNQGLIFEDSGEEKLMDMIGGQVGDEDTTRSFINFCTTYLIVQNMNIDK